MNIIGVGKFLKLINLGGDLKGTRGGILINGGKYTWNFQQMNLILIEENLNFELEKSDAHFFLLFG